MICFSLRKPGKNFVHTASAFLKTKPAGSGCQLKLFILFEYLAKYVSGFAKPPR